jgi:hypothetical protein
MAEDIETYERETLTEISLSRVASHVEKRPFAILTAFRGSNSLQTNRTLNKKLENDIRSAGFGFEKLIGTYEEELEDGSKRRVTEESFMVIGDDESKTGAIRSFAKKSGEKYEQDCVFFKEPSKKQGTLIGTKEGVWPGKGVVTDVGEFRPNRLNGIFSALKTKNNKAVRGFKFESIEHPLTVTQIWVKNIMKKKGLENGEQVS